MKFFLGFILLVLFSFLWWLAGPMLTLVTFSTFAGWMFVSFLVLSGKKITVRFPPPRRRVRGVKIADLGALGRAMRRDG